MKKDQEAKKLENSSIQITQNGNRLRFAAGKWRTKQGNLADFYQQPRLTAGSVTTSVAMVSKVVSTSIATFGEKRNYLNFKAGLERQESGFENCSIGTSFAPS